MLGPSKESQKECERGVAKDRSKIVQKGRDLRCDMSGRNHFIPKGRGPPVGRRGRRNLYKLWTLRVSLPDEQHIPSANGGGRLPSN